jgi:glycogen(starch) synthase
MRDRLPKRILMTADTVGGVWSYTLRLARALDRYDIEVIIATMGEALSPAQRDQIQSLSNVQVRESTYKLEWMQNPWKDVQAAGEWLLSLEDEFEPDLIHLNGYAHGNLPWRAPRIVVGHSCVLSWWRAIKSEDAPAEYGRYKEAVQAGLRAADCVVAPSRTMMGYLFEHYGAFENAVVIWNGCEADRYAPGKKENFILSAGRLWDEAKNVRAVCACSFELPWRLCVAGETKHPDGCGNGEYRRSDDQERSDSEVKYLGRLNDDEMAECFGRAPIYALPAKYEPFGLSILEASLSGCALVLGDIPSLRENWDGASIFVDPDSKEQLKTAILKLIHNSALRNDLAVRARSRGLTFSMERTGREYLKVYQTVLGRNNPRLHEESLAAV